MARSHLLRPMTDTEGNLLIGATVTVLNSDGITLIDQPMVDIDGVGLSNPFVSSTGIIDFYLDAPQRVNILADLSPLPQLSVYLDVFPPAPEIVTSNGGALRITNTPAFGDVLYASTVFGEAQWGPAV